MANAVRDGGRGFGGFGVIVVSVRERFFQGGEEALDLGLVVVDVRRDADAVPSDGISNESRCDFKRLPFNVPGRCMKSSSQCRLWIGDCGLQI